MLHRKYFQDNNIWDLLAKLILLGLAVLQISRWPTLPHFLDIYYHLQVAWGFIQSGGYVHWDFWEYAPLGRPHIYPPLFHIILALLMKLGASVVFLAKFFESVTPVIFLVVLWRFIRKNYSRQLGFFTVVALGSSFAFSISQANHVPSTIALILGFLSYGEFFKSRYLRAVILLALCFYTHITVSWFFALSYIFYALLDKDSRGNSLRTFLGAVLIASPILILQLLNLHSLHLVSDNIFEKFHLQIKVFDCILACFGLFLAARQPGRHKLFVSLFLSSFIFLPYPARFLSAEGYIPVILFLALALQFIWQKLAEGGARLMKILTGGLIIFFLFISPTLYLGKPSASDKVSYRVDPVDATLSSLLLAKGNSIWYPWMYLPAAEIIKNNSASGDIVYSNLDIAGLILSSLSQRATVNGLLPESKSFRQADPFLLASIIVLPKDLDEEFINGISHKYKLIKIDQTRYFYIFRNPAPVARLEIVNTVFGFWLIIGSLFLLAVLFWRQELMSLSGKPAKSGGR